MMQQQVNLYLPELRPRRDWMDAWHAAVLLGIFVGVLLIVQLFSVMRAAGLEAEVAQQEEVVSELQAQADKIQSSSVAVSSKSLDVTITQLELAIANRKKVGRIISGQNMGNARGFHTSMLSLARESLDDLALERFTFARGGNYIQMRGETRNAQAVPLYLQRLKADPALNQARFGLMSVSSEKQSAQVFEFSLGYDNLYLQKPARGQ